MNQQVDGFHNLTIKEAAIPKLKTTEVLVKIHAVSLQYRDLMISNGQYPSGAKEGIIPCSDGAGEIRSVSDSVKNFKVGERVCANFSLEHLYGDVVDYAQMAAALGGNGDGCLTEVRAFPAYVCDVLLPY